jgi:peptidyl-prolyl cis-trans isomerase SurA
MRYYLNLSLSIVGLSLCSMSFAQPASQLVDQVDAIIGSKIVLNSEVQDHYLEYVGQNAVTNGTRCLALEDLMYQKLLLTQAEKDTNMIVSDAQLDQELNKRIEYFVKQLGSKEKFESFYGKTIEQFKEEYRPDVKDMLLAQLMRNKIVDGVTVTPEEVRNFFESFPKDSIPNINAQIEIAEIVKMPEITEEEKMIARQKCEELRQRVIKGEAMSPLAVLYSDDPAAQKNAGEYKNVKRGEFVPDLEKVVFALNDGDISEVFEPRSAIILLNWRRDTGSL